MGAVTNTATLGYGKYVMGTAMGKRLYDKKGNFNGSTIVSPPHTYAKKNKSIYMKKVQIILFYLIIALSILSGAKLEFSNIIIYFNIVLIVISAFIGLKYNVLYILSEKRIGQFKIKNSEAFYGIIIFFIGFLSMHFGLKNNGIEKDFFNFYYLLMLPIYLLSLIRVKKDYKLN